MALYRVNSEYVREQLKEDYEFFRRQCSGEIAEDIFYGMQFRDILVSEDDANMLVVIFGNDAIKNWCEPRGYQEWKQE